MGEATIRPTAGRHPVDALALPAALALGVAAFFPTILELVQYWAHYPEYSHGFLMPIVAVWLAWDRRDAIKALRPTFSWLGTAVAVVSLAVLLLGEMKLSWFLKPYALVGYLTGVLWAFYGWRAVRVALPSLVVLLLMCPLPGRVQNALTLPLKNTAARMATGLLDVTGAPVILEGNVIHLPGMSGLWVADACSGVRSLISLFSLAFIACMLWPGSWLLRTLIVLSSIPIAVLVNGLRIWITGLLAWKVGPEAAEGFFHFFEGFLLFGVGALLLWLWAILLARLFPAEAS